MVAASLHPKRLKTGAHTSWLQTKPWARRVFRPTYRGPPHSPLLHLVLYNSPRTPHIPGPYVAVDFDPDLAHRTGDCLRTADLGGPHAAATQRRIRGSFRLGDDREYLRGTDHNSPDQGHGLPRWNIFRRYPSSDDFDREAELGTKDWSPRKRAQEY